MRRVVTKEKALSVYIVLTMALAALLAYAAPADAAKELVSSEVFQEAKRRILVTTPEQGQVVYAGKNCKIIWLPTMGMTEYNKVQLTWHRGKGETGASGLIAKNAKNDGKLTWKVPEDMKPGSYRIVLVQDKGVPGISYVFQIKEKPSDDYDENDDRTLTVTDPEKDEATSPGKTLKIRWDLEGDWDGMKRVNLGWERKENGGTHNGNVARNVKNDGNYDWELPENLKPGRYRIVVKTTNDNPLARSHYFNVNKAEDYTGAVLTRPDQGETVTPGEDASIRWQLGDWSRRDDVKLQLRDAKNKEFVLNITQDTDNDGRFTWSVPKDLAPGRYFIRMYNLDESRNMDGPVFRVEAGQGFRITNPKQNEKIAAGGRYRILWTNNNGWDRDAEASISLCRERTGGVLCTTLAERWDVDENGYAWRIPQDLKPGEYFIKMINQDQGMFAVSGDFTITGPGQGGDEKISFILPDKDTRVRPGDSLDILWETKGISADKTMVITWTRKHGSSSVSGEIAQVKNDGHYRWDVPRNLRADDYYITITYRDYSGQSETFTVKQR